MTDLSEIIKQPLEIVTPFDEFECEALLDEIQGNIIKSHGRNHSVHLFLQFTCNPETAKHWIGCFTHRYVTSALAQAQEAKEFRQNKNVPGKIFANFFLTKAGYEYLGYGSQHIPSDDHFLKGMKDPQVQKDLGDDVQQWESGFQSTIHAFVLMAADRIVGPRTEEAKKRERKDPSLLRKQPAYLDLKVASLKRELNKGDIAKIVHEDIGYVLRSSETGAEVEHFGFRDGVSQPLFLKRDIEKERAHSDFSKWDPRAPLSLVLFKDPLGKNEASYGSFLVYRKLEQNVKAWNDDVRQLADKLKGQGQPDEELAGAYAMGRFKDGTPVALAEKPTHQEPEANNFDHAEDLQGLKCPFHSHTRKMNPRGDTGRPEEEKTNRIVRRGINYGHLPSEEPEKDAGLLFMCFQASLMHQFKVLQQFWAKSKNFPHKGVGTDAVIGVEKLENGQFVGETYEWPAAWGQTEKTKAEFVHWINMRGGEYFFAPSMDFLRSLAPAPARNITFRGVPKQEIEAARAVIEELRQYQQRNWSIGFNGDTMEPDGFLTFFDQRNLPFQFYLLNQVPLGDSSAYDRNIATLEQYIEDIRTQETEASEYKIAELKEYRELGWAIGFDGGTLEPDGFVTFFGARELPFRFFVERGEVSLGDETAYDANIATLYRYIDSLRE